MPLRPYAGLTSSSCFNTYAAPPTQHSEVACATGSCGGGGSDADKERHMLDTPAYVPRRPAWHAHGPSTIRTTTTLPEHEPLTDARVFKAVLGRSGLTDQFYSGGMQKLVHHLSSAAWRYTKTSIATNGDLLVEFSDNPDIPQMSANGESFNVAAQSRLAARAHMDARVRAGVNRDAVGRMAQMHELSADLHNHGAELPVHRNVTRDAVRGPAAHERAMRQTWLNHKPEQPRHTTVEFPSKAPHRYRVHSNLIGHPEAEAPHMRVPHSSAAAARDTHAISMMGAAGRRADEAGGQAVGVPVHGTRVRSMLDDMNRPEFHALQEDAPGTSSVHAGRANEHGQWTAAHTEGHVHAENGQDHVRVPVESAGMFSGMAGTTSLLSEGHVHAEYAPGREVVAPGAGGHQPMLQQPVGGFAHSEYGTRTVVPVYDGSSGAVPHTQNMPAGFVHAETAAGPTSVPGSKGVDRSYAQPAAGYVVDRDAASQGYVHASGTGNGMPGTGSHEGHVHAEYAPGRVRVGAEKHGGTPAMPMALSGLETRKYDEHGHMHIVPVGGPLNGMRTAQWTEAHTGAHSARAQASGSVQSRQVVQPQGPMTHLPTVWDSVAEAAPHVPDFQLAPDAYMQGMGGPAGVIAAMRNYSSSSVDL